MTCPRSTVPGDVFRFLTLRLEGYGAFQRGLTSRNGHKSARNELSDDASLESMVTANWTLLHRDAARELEIMYINRLHRSGRCGELGIAAARAWLEHCERDEESARRVLAACRGARDE